MNRIATLGRIRNWSACLTLTLLAACGGGGGGGSSTTPPPTPPSGLSYPAPPAFVVGTAISPLTPTVTGTVTSYSVSPALPAGLALNAGSGVIAGTPTAVAAKASYTVTASNLGGSTTASVSITVGPAIASTPVIATQPRSASVPVYRTAAFTIAATGNGTLSYQWYSGSSPGGVAIAGQTSATLTVSTSVNVANAGTYYCIVTNTVNATKATTTSNNAVLTVLAQRSTATVSGESAVLPGSVGHVVSSPAQAGVTYSWSITNGTITAGQGTDQVTYTAGSLGHIALTVTILTPTGVAVATQSIAVVASVPVVSVFAQPEVLPGSVVILASAPAFGGDTYSWTLSSGTATATISAGQTADVLTYTVGFPTGTYQAGLTLTDSAGHVGTDAETVNVVSNVFVPDPRDLGPRSLHTATLLNDGRVLIAGGDAGIPAASQNSVLIPVPGPISIILATAALFDPATGTFASIAPMSTPRFEHTATLLNDGRVLVVGGTNSSSAALASTEIYDPASRSWSAGPSLANARTLHTATLLSDGRVLVAGGVNSPSVGDEIVAAEIFDPSTNAWSAAGTMVAPRVLHAAALLPNGQVLVVGGTNASGALSDAELYDPVANHWTRTAYLPAVERGDGLVTLLSGQVFEVGESVLYDPATATWVYAVQSGAGPGPMTPNAVLLSDGRVFVSGALGTGTTTAVYDPVAQSWTTTSSIVPASGQYSSATLLADGRMLTLGGLQPLAGASGTAALFDPIAGTATRVSSGAHQGALAAVAADGASGPLLFSGGFLDGFPPGAQLTAATDLYTPQSNTWTSLAPMSTARGGHSATWLATGNVLVTGGYTNQAALASAESYDGNNNTWSSAGTMANPRYEHTASLLGNGMVLVAGGSNALIGSCSCTTFLSAAELYNPTTNTWGATGSLATARYAHTATVLQSGKVLVAGGFGGVPNLTQNVGAPLPTVEIYDPSTGLWSAAAAPMNNARYNHTATLLSSGQVLVTGGTGVSGALATAEVYDPVANTWTNVGSLATARASHSAVLLPSGDVLVVGGYNAAASQEFGIGTAELYDPVAQTFSAAGAMNTLRQAFTLSSVGSGRVLLVGGLPNAAGLAEFYQ